MGKPENEILQGPQLTREEWSRIIDSLAYHFDAGGCEVEHEKNMAVAEKILAACPDVRA